MPLQSVTPTILAIDVGLTNCKAVWFDADGRVASMATSSYATDVVAVGMKEQDPSAWWAAVVAVVTGSRPDPNRVGSLAVISVTGHMHALVCADADGRPLRPALILGDQRSLAEARSLSAALGERRIHELTGTRMDASMPAAKLLWLRHHEPDTFAAIRRVLGVKDYLRGVMTGDFATEPVDACATSLYDLTTQTWASELVEAVGIDPAILPPIISPQTIAGVLRPSAAADLGLPAGVPVVIGAGDDVEVLGAGMLDAGLALEHLGTTGSMLMVARDLVFDPARAVEVYPHSAPDLWVFGGSTTTAGAAIDWASTVLGFADVDSTFLVAGLRAPDVNRPLVFLPYLEGERAPAWRSGARGAWFGLDPSHDRADLLGAVLTGVVLSLRSILASGDELVGRHDAVLVAGRDAENDAWLRTRASVYGRPVGVLAAGDPTALGAMILGAVGVGLYPSLRDAVAATTRVARWVEPNRSHAAAYDELHALFMRLQAANDVARPVAESDVPTPAAAASSLMAG